MLHLGFVDEGLFEDRFREGSWLHAKLARITRKLVGLDISIDGVNRARELGFEDSYVGDVEKLSAAHFPRLNYDVILAPDIIEHVANPGAFLSELRGILTDNTSVVLTTPNALSIRTTFYPLLYIEVVHPDHNFYCSPTTLATLLRKNGFAISELWLYSSVWTPNFESGRSVKENLLKAAYLPLDLACRYLLVPIFPYFGDGMMLDVCKTK